MFEDGDAQSVGKWRGEAGLLSTPPDGNFPMQNVGPVKFEPPDVPVIFVLGMSLNNLELMIICLFRKYKFHLRIFLII